MASACTRGTMNAHNILHVIRVSYSHDARLAKGVRNLDQLRGAVTIRRLVSPVLVTRTGVGQARSYGSNGTLERKLQACAVWPDWYWASRMDSDKVAATSGDKEFKDSSYIHPSIHLSTRRCRS